MANIYDQAGNQLYTPDIEIAPLWEVVGRPTKYKDDMPLRAFDILCVGKSKTAVAVALGIHIDTLYEWMKVHTEFSEAIKRGLDAGLAWWEDLARAQARGQEGIMLGTGYIMYMRNVYKLKTKDDDDTAESMAKLAAEMAVLRAGNELADDEWVNRLVKKTDG